MLDVFIMDTTLREGEQNPGTVFSKDEKIEIAKMLDDARIQSISVGMPIIGPEERDAIKAITKENLNCSVSALCRCNKADIDAARECDLSGIILFIGSSEKHMAARGLNEEKVMEMVGDAIDYSKDHGIVPFFAPEDATRTNFDFLYRLYKMAIDHGVPLIAYPDTVGVLTPESARDNIALLIKLLNVPVAVHFHNDFGLALGNTLSAYFAGAHAISSTICGLGERAGNVATEEVVMSLEVLYGIKTGIKLDLLYEIAKKVEKISGIPISPLKPIIGNNVFSHESGIHTQIIKKDPSTYEAIPIELIKRDRSFRFGKHSGKNLIQDILKQNNIEINEDDFNKLLNEMKDYQKVRTKYTSADFMSKYYEYLDSRSLNEVDIINMAKKIVAR